jgi:hypothetical protein
MGRRTILIALFVATAFVAPPASALMVSVTPAWNGWARANMPTEVAIRVVGDHGGPLTLTLTDRSMSYTRKASLEPDVELVWRVPLSPPSGEPLHLRAQLGDEPGIEQEITLQRHLTPAPLVAVLADQPIPLGGVRAETINVAVDSLPFHDSSHAAVDLVLVHRDSLKGMARQQLSALRQHVARCGRLVIVDFAPAATTSFADVAGCGGRFLVAAETGADLEALVESLLEEPVPQLPSAGSLRALLDGNGMEHQITSLVVFFAIYLCVLVVAVRTRRAPVYFISASMAATLIGLVAWAMTPEHIDRVAWTEMENRATAGRFTLLLRVLGGGDRVTMDLPANVGPLRALQPVNLQVASGHDGGGAATVSFDTRLFSQHEFVASGVTALSSPLIVDHSTEVPRIVNSGTGPSPPAVLAWNGGRYSVPSLSPAGDWQPESSPEPWGSGRAEQLFRQRALRETTALLVEYPPGDPLPADNTHRYLMVRP